MNILLAGASGFLGKNFLLRAPSHWRIVALYRQDTSFPEFVARAGKAEITPVRCDLANSEQVDALFREYGREWESCLYLAAKVDIPWSVREPEQDLIFNLCPLLNLLAGLRAHRFVYFSSGAVYDGMNGEVHPHLQPSPTLPYAISKLASERYVQFHSQRRRSIENYLIVRFFGAYGPYEAPHKVFTRLIQTFTVEGQEAYTIYGDGQNLIDAMYVEDAIDAIQRILAGNHWNDTINLAAGRPLTIEALVREAAKALGLGFVRVENEGIAQERNQFWASTAEMREYFGFEPVVSLPEGIRRFKEFLVS